MSDPDLIVFALKDVFISKLFIHRSLSIVIIIGIIIHGNKIRYLVHLPFIEVGD